MPKESSPLHHANAQCPITNDKKMKSSIKIDDATLTKLLTSALSDLPKKLEVFSCVNPGYVALRQNGVLLCDYWLDKGEVFSALHGTISSTISNEGFQKVDAIELCLTHHYRPVSLKNFPSKFANTKRGIRGIRLQYQSQVAIYSPTQMIANNLSFPEVFDSFLESLSLSAEAFENGGGIIEAFEGIQILITLDSSIPVTMYRGNQIVPLAEMSSQTISDMLGSMGKWLIQTCAENGRLIYKYSPSTNQPLDDNNINRQFIATLGLIRYAKFTGQSDRLTLADQNLAYNLAQYYRLQSCIGGTEHQGKVELGTTALAALAILEHHESDRYSEIFQMLCQEIQESWQNNGSFSTGYQPRAQNFNPGAALLFWASLYKKNHDEHLLQRCRKSFFYYREWHLAHRHPAFIPWHTQAYALLYDETGDPIFRDFIFEINDWLLPMQQSGELRSIDARGRFYNPKHKEYGLPHAAATGNYLQGLVDAYRLAWQNNDTARANAYELAIWRGLRNIRQLQFKDDVDMFYIKERSPVQGSIRTAVYDNTIRIDNVQQSLMAILKLYQLPAFPKQAPPPKPGFRRLKQGVNIAPLMAEITEKSPLWFYDTSRQQKVAPQAETQSIFLRRAAKPFPVGVDNARDVHDSCPTEVAKEFPVVMNWVEEFVKEIGGELGRLNIVRFKEIGGELGRLNIVRLAPKGRVYSHIDHGEYYRLRDRYHLVLQSRSGSWMKCGNQEAVMHEGELWWFDNKQPHEAFNPSEQWRIHIIFDVLPEISLRQ